MQKRHQWSIDLILESVVRVEVDGQGIMHVPQWMLPRGIREGDVFMVEHDVTSDRSELRIERDAEATARARAQARPRRSADGDDMRL